MKVLCTGDIHIGRRSSRLPEHLDDRAHAAADAWARIVDFALEAGVDVVALSGDVVDQENRFYEAVGPLERGIRRLAGAGITTVAVSGNHDHDVLPRLAAEFASERFRLVGLGGEWERTTIERHGETLHIVGWSFPQREVRESPLAAFRVDSVPDDGVPVLGLLHADLDQPASIYAPVALAELRATPVDFWLLGHIHAPRLETSPGTATVLYPGSPQALDPGESGAHGIWLLETGPGRTFRVAPVALSSVRYDTVVVDVDAVDDVAEFDRRVMEAVRGHLASAVADGGRALRVLSCRLRIVGRTALHRELEARAERIAADLALDDGDAVAVVERVMLDTRPAHDLEALARGSDPVGVLARLLLGLESGMLDAEQARLLSDATSRIVEVRRARPYLALSADVEGSEAAARAALVRQASLLLDELLAQKEAVR